MPSSEPRPENPYLAVSPHEVIQERADGFIAGLCLGLAVGAWIVVAALWVVSA